MRRVRKGSCRSKTAGLGPAGNSIGENSCLCGPGDQSLCGLLHRSNAVPRVGFHRIVGFADFELVD